MLPASRAALPCTPLGRAAVAHERLAPGDQVGELRDRDRLHDAILSSIGHELRAPMAGCDAVEALPG